MNFLSHEILIVNPAHLSQNVTGNLFPVTGNLFSVRGNLFLFTGNLSPVTAQDIFPVYERKFIVTGNLFPVTRNKFPLTGNKFPVTRMIFYVRENSFLMKFWLSFRCITFSRQMCGINYKNFV